MPRFGTFSQKPQGLAHTLIVYVKLRKATSHDVKKCHLKKPSGKVSRLACPGVAENMSMQYVATWLLQSPAYKHLLQQWIHEGKKTCRSWPSVGLIGVAMRLWNRQNLSNSLRWGSSIPRPRCPWPEKVILHYFVPSQTLTNGLECSLSELQVVSDAGGFPIAFRSGGGACQLRSRGWDVQNLSWPQIMLELACVKQWLLNCFMLWLNQNMAPKAALSLQAAAQEFTSCSGAHVDITSACEIDPICQRVLKDTYDDQQCIFPDILKMDMKKGSCFCLRHQKLCNLESPDDDKST